MRFYTVDHAESENLVCEQDTWYGTRECIHDLYLSLRVKGFDFHRSRVDHIHDVVNGDGRLSNVGSQDDLTNANGRTVCVCVCVCVCGL